MCDGAHAEAVANDVVGALNPLAHPVHPSGRWDSAMCVTCVHAGVGSSGSMTSASGRWSHFKRNNDCNKHYATYTHTQTNTHTQKEDNIYIQSWIL